jgi:hypothetical protein
MNLLSVIDLVHLFSLLRKCALRRMPILAVLGMTPKHNHHPVGSWSFQVLHPRNLTFVDAVGALPHKVAECRTEKWQPMNLLSVIDLVHLCSHTKEVCTTQNAFSRCSEWRPSTIIILLDPEFPGASTPEISHLMQ